MARAHKIYLVFRDGQEDPLAAFTVKHEAITWFGKQFDKWETEKDMWITSTPDGSDFSPQTVWDSEDQRNEDAVGP